MKKIAELTATELKAYQALKTQNEKRNFLKSLTVGNNLPKKEKEVSLFTLMLNANKANKQDVFSLSKMLKNINPELPENKAFFEAAKFDATNLSNTKFFIQNATKITVKGVSKYYFIDGELYFKATIKKQLTDVKKSLWSLWDIEQIIRLTAK